MRTAIRPLRSSSHSLRAAWTLIGVALMVAACRAPLPAAPQISRPRFTPPPPATEFLVKESALIDGAVSVRLDIPLSPGGPKPTIISLVGDTHPIVAAGFVAATYRINWVRLKGLPPPIPADQTVGKWVLASPSADLLGERYLRDIAATATEYVPAIIDWLESVPEVDATRIGMAGVSTNGFVTLQAVAADRRIRAAVAVAACGDYHLFLRDSSMGMEGKPLRLAPTYDRWVRSQELVRHPERAVHAAVLMANRSSDGLIPITCADATATALTDAYARAGVPEQFRYIRSDQKGHGLAPEEYRETLDWLQDWLLRQ